MLINLRLKKKRRTCWMVFLLLFMVSCILGPMPAVAEDEPLAQPNHISLLQTVEADDDTILAESEEENSPGDGQPAAKEDKMDEALADTENSGNSNTLSLEIETAAVDIDADISAAVERIIAWYQSNYPAPTSWEGLPALWGAGEDLNQAPWETSQPWRLQDPGFQADSSGNEQIHYSFRLLAVGENPSLIWGGRNLLAELAAQQKNDGSFGNLGKDIWALVILDIGRELGLDTGLWDEEKQQDTIAKILSQQKSNGSFGAFSELDFTAWALVALANHQEQPAVKNAINEAVDFLHSKQQDNGGFAMAGEWGVENSNSNAAVISGLVAVGEDLLDPAGRWVKNDHTVVEALLKFQQDDGSFWWQQETAGSIKASTTQALTALVDLKHGRSVKHRLGEELFLPETPETASVHLRVEGIEENLFTGKVEAKYAGGQDLTALSVLQQGLEEAQITFEITWNESFASYEIVAIAGEAKGSFGGWDGWMFLKNGEMASAGADQTVVEEGDELVFYYGGFPPGTLIPQVKIIPPQPLAGEEIVVEVRSSYYDWAAEEMVEVQVEGARVSFAGQVYLTGAAGQAVIPGGGVSKPGSYTLQVEKNVEGSFPALVRTGEIVVEVSAPVIETAAVDLRVEGIEENLFTGTVEAEYAGGQDLTALSVLQQGLEEAQIPFEITWNESFASYEIVAIAGEAKGSFGGWDGWMFLKNGEMASAGADQTSVKAGDELVFYYGGFPPGTLIPQVDIIPQHPVAGEELRVKVTSSYYDWGTNAMVEVKIEGALVSFGGQEYLTDGGGQVVIPGEQVSEPGSYTLQVEKNVEGSFPALVRTGEMVVEVSARPPSGGGGAGGGSSPATRTVTLAVDKKTIGGGYIIPTTRLQLAADDTAYSVLKREADKRGITVHSQGSGSSIYISAIDGLKEFDHGPLSGWKYSVNGVYPSKSPGDTILSAGDTLYWRYTTDGGVDLEQPQQGPASSTPQGIKPEQKMDEAMSILLRKKKENAAAWMREQLDYSEPGHQLDWSVFALARAGGTAPGNYGTLIEDYVRQEKGEFRLVTDCARIALTAGAAGKNPLDLAGYNLIEKIYYHPGMTRQGVNGPVFALLALDAKSYPVAEDARWNQDSLIDWILGQQDPAGGFPLYRGEESSMSEVDVTAMVLQALTPYQEQAKVQVAIEKALSWLAGEQKPSGGFESWGVETCESVAQVLMALTALNQDPQVADFIKAEGSLLTNLLSFAHEDGGFAHARGEAGDILATQQALMALTSYQRWLEGHPRLFDLQDVEFLHQDKEIYHYRDQDRISWWAAEQVRKAWEYGLMRGVSERDPLFEPSRALTRAEITALLVRLTGLEPFTGAPQQFIDVKPEDWFYGYIMAARAGGMVQGTSETGFDPTQNVTREQMATMLARLLDIEQAGVEPGQLKDLATVSSWAIPGVQGVIYQGIMLGDGQYFYPMSPLTREMAAVIAVRVFEEHVMDH